MAALGFGFILQLSSSGVSSLPSLVHLVMDSLDSLKNTCFCSPPQILILVLDFGITGSQPLSLNGGSCVSPSWALSRFWSG